MVNLSPELPDSVEELPRANGNVVTQSDEESEEDGSATALSNMGYELLLPIDTNSTALEEGSSEESEDEFAEFPEPVTIPAVPVAGPSYPQNSAPNNDVEIDIERIRSIMSNITLPPSAVPAWASEIHESDWTSHLKDLITKLQHKS